jgi:hypothetical protein
MIIWTLRRAEGRIEKQILYGKVLCSTPQFNSYPPHFTVLLHFTPTTLHYIITQHTTSQHTAQYNEAKQSTPLYTAHHTTPHHITCAKSEHGEGVCEGSPEAHRRELLPVLRSHLRSFAQTSDPVSTGRGYVRIV